MIVYLAYLKAKKLGKKIKIYSNIQLYNIEFEWLDARDLIELNENLQDSIIFIDELQMIADSRTPQSLENRCIANFILQSRHRNCVIIYTTQFATNVDKRIRQNTADYYVSYKRDTHRFELTSLSGSVFFNGKPLYHLYNTHETVSPFIYTDKKALKEILTKLEEKQQKDRQKYFGKKELNKK